jgi:hypothetical protein
MKFSWVFVKGYMYKAVSNEIFIATLSENSII